MIHRSHHTLPVLLFVVIFTFFGCQSTQVIERTEEQILFAREAVGELLLLVLSSASDSFRTEGPWVGSSAELIPPEAFMLVGARDTIPGIKQLLNRYLNEANMAVSQIAEDLPQFTDLNQMVNTILEDPFQIVEGQPDAVTRFFATNLSGTLEQWLSDQLNGTKGARTRVAWNQLVLVYNTYVRAQNQIPSRSEEPPLFEIETSCERTIIISMIRHLITTMTAQEALVRTMAPAYEDPRITLFATR